MNQTLREKVRERYGKETTFSAAIVDSQSVKTTEVATKSRLRWGQISQRSQAAHLS